MTKRRTPTPPAAPSSYRRRAKDQDETGVSAALADLIQAAQSRGRDAKLVSALLRTLADFVVEVGGEVYMADPTDHAAGEGAGEEAPVEATVEPERRKSISPALRTKLRAVIDSLSDDETARYLGVSVRQVRRRALSGNLYFFAVGRKRRYPCWQFTDYHDVLPGNQIVNRGRLVTVPPPNAHASSAKIGIRETTRRLNALLGPTLVASLTGSPDPRISYEWARVDGPEPKTDAVRRLQFAYAQWLAISASEGEQVARMWFIGSNPLLNYDTPVDAIRTNRFQETAAAAVATFEDRFNG